METPIAQEVEPYRYFWLHTNVPKNITDPNILPASNNKKMDGAWNDGDHSIGTLNEYCFGKYDDILVVVERLIRVESDDKEHKWHRITDTEKKFAVMKFEKCVALGQSDKRRARFRSGDSLLILSSDPIDAEIFDFITGALTDDGK